MTDISSFEASSTPPSPIRSSVNHVVKVKNSKVRLNHHGWIYAGVVSLIFSILIFLATSAVWILSGLALKHYRSTECISNAMVDSSIRKCVSGYVPIGQGMWLSVFSIINMIIGLILSINPNRRYLWVNLVGNLLNITTVGCLSLFDFMFSWHVNMWLTQESLKIKHLFLSEGIMASILVLLHFISLFLTLLSLLQPCDDHCRIAKCSSNPDSSNASTPSHIKEFNAANAIADTTI